MITAISASIPVFTATILAAVTVRNPHCRHNTA
jgi:hypothetical protein